MGFSQQESWSGLPCPSPGDLPNPEIVPTPPKSPALAGGFFTTSTTWEVYQMDVKVFTEMKKPGGEQTLEGLQKSS